MLGAENTNANGSGEELTSSFPVPITTDYDRPEEKNVTRLTSKDLHVAGSILITIVTIATILNIYTVIIINKNWKRFIKYPFFQSNMLCMFLTVSDLVLAVFVGIPVAIHLLLFEKVSSPDDPYPVLHYYTKNVGQLALDYLFLLRVITIAVVCIDRSAHILKPLQYKFYVRHSVTAVLCLSMTLLPFVMTLLPSILYLTLKDAQNNPIALLHCITPKSNGGEDPFTNDRLDIPLMCRVGITKSTSFKDETTVNTLSIIESAVSLAVVIGTCFTIVISNIVIISTIAKRRGKIRSLGSDDTNKKQEKAAYKILVATAAMSIVFLLTSLPFVIQYLDYVLASFFGEAYLLFANYRLRYACILSIFVSLLVNPWLYTFRMQTIRQFFPCFGEGGMFGGTSLFKTRTSFLSNLTLSTHSLKIMKGFPGSKHSTPKSEHRTETFTMYENKLGEGDVCN